MQKLAFQFVKLNTLRTVRHTIRTRQIFKCIQALNLYLSKFGQKNVNSFL